jgi:hypothetical protein
MNDSMIVGGAAIAGAATGVAVTIASATGGPAMTTIAVLTGLTIGVTTGMLGGLGLTTLAGLVRPAPRNRSVNRKSRKRNRVSPSFRHRRCSRHPGKPLPFRHRLAKFTKQDAADLLHHRDVFEQATRESVISEKCVFESKMAFWSKGSFLTGVLPKSPGLIRRYLMAIRRAVGRSVPGP